jgi:hypothetical protein
MLAQPFGSIVEPMNFSDSHTIQSRSITGVGKPCHSPGLAATVEPTIGEPVTAGATRTRGAIVMVPFDPVTTPVDPEFAFAVTLAKTCFPASSAAKTYEFAVALAISTQSSGTALWKLRTVVAHRYHWYSKPFTELDDAHEPFVMVTVLPKLAPVDKLGGTCTTGLEVTRPLEIEERVAAPMEFVAETAATSRFPNSASLISTLERLNVRRVAVVRGEVVVPSPI